VCFLYTWQEEKQQKRNEYKLAHKHIVKKNQQQDNETLL